MFVRRKKNRSGTTSIVVVDKSRGRFRELVTIGVASDEEELRLLERKGHEWIAGYGGQQFLRFEENGREQESMERMLANITSTRLCAPQTIIGKVYERIGFNALGDEELRHLVIVRICQSMSKSATIDSCAGTSRTTSACRRYTATWTSSTARRRNKCRR